MNISSTIGSRLEDLIHELRLNNNSFSVQIRISPTNVAHIISGKNQPSFKTINKIKEAFPQVSEKWLLSGEGTMFNSAGDYNNDTPVSRTDIGTRIAQLIKELGISSAAFARQIGITPPSVSAIVSGKSKPRYELVEKILETFPKLSRIWLMEGRGNMFGSNNPPPTATAISESSYLQNYLQKLEEGFKQEYQKIMEEKDAIISSQRFIIDTLISGQKEALGKLNLSEEILPVIARVVDLPHYRNVA